MFLIKYMAKGILHISTLGLFIASLFPHPALATVSSKNSVKAEFGFVLRDTVAPADVMEVIVAAINSINNFNIDAVANLYTPNAVVADDEPPYSWNGPLAGVQWVNAVEKVCKDNRLRELKGVMRHVSVFQQNGDNVYIIVPVDYTGSLPGKESFEAHGAFTFVLRQINGKWMIKSQVWVPGKGM